MGNFCRRLRNIADVPGVRSHAFFLGVAESAVFPATLVLLANWFSRCERARANSYWLLCQPLAVAGSAPVTGWLLGSYGWQQMLIFEGILPFLWLPIWWFFIRDHPSETKWISSAEKNHLATELKREATDLEPAQKNFLVAKIIASLHPRDDRTVFFAQLRRLCTMRLSQGASLTV